jgi:hypothetical protein
MPVIIELSFLFQPHSSLREKMILTLAQRNNEYLPLSGSREHSLERGITPIAFLIHESALEAR